MNPGDKIGRTLWLEARDQELFIEQKKQLRFTYLKTRSASLHAMQEDIRKAIYGQALENYRKTIEPIMRIKSEENTRLMAEARAELQRAQESPATQETIDRAKAEHESRISKAKAIYDSELSAIAPLIVKRHIPKSQPEALKAKHSEDRKEYRIMKMQEREEQMILKKELARQKAEEQLRKARAGHLTPKQLRLQAEAYDNTKQGRI